MRRRYGGTCNFRAVSSIASPPMTMVPRLGFDRPAIMLMIELLPAPDAPNRPVTRLSLSNAASSLNSPSCLVTLTLSMSQPMNAAQRASREELRRDQRADRHAGGNNDQPQGGQVAVRHLNQRIDRR